MTATTWLNRAVSALLALALLIGSLLVIAEVAAAALDRGPWLVPYPEWTEWMRSRSWNDWVVVTVLVGLVLVGLLLLALALRRGKPATLPLRGRTPGVTVKASRRSVERSLAAAAARTSGVTGADASVRRRSARIGTRTATRSGSDVRQEVESAVKDRLDSLGLARDMRTRVAVSTKERR
jgi:ABC-type Fe3+ transport system permease subunit